MKTNLRVMKVRVRERETKEQVEEIHLEDLY
jgi:hypothetical protein